MELVGSILTLHWLQFQVTVGDRVEIQDVPVWARPTEDADDFLDAHPAWVTRATISLQDRFGPDATIDYRKEIDGYHVKLSQEVGSW